MGARTLLVLVTAVVLAALVHGGIYQMVAAGGGGAENLGVGDVFAWRVNRFTGSVALCTMRVCVRRPVETEE